MQKITKFICKIIKKAAKITNQPFNVYDKDDKGDVVTDLDTQIEEFLITKLNDKYPEFDIVSEEYYPNKEISSNCFVIDPIDGSRNFVAGIPLWGMQIAVIEGGEMQSCVIYLPKIGELYYADADGAYLNGQRLEITPNIQKQRPVYEIAGGNRCQALVVLEKEISRNFRYLGSSAVSFAWIAAGRIAGFVLRKDNKWDYKPGLFLVKTAGGLVKDEPGLHMAAATEEMMQVLSKYHLETEEPVPNPELAPKTIKKKTTKK